MKPDDTLSTKTLESNTLDYSTLLWIVGITIIVIAGIYIIKKRSSMKFNNLLKKAKHNSIEKTESTTQQNQFNLIAAKKTFLNNIDKFIPKLDSLCDGTYNHKEWTEKIIEINDENLTSLWKNIFNNKEYILRILSQWGIKPEMCTSFFSLESHKELYIKNDGKDIEAGKKYKVIKQCWVSTQTNNEGKIIKSILTKGKVIEL